MTSMLPQDLPLQTIQSAGNRCHMAWVALVLVSFTVFCGFYYSRNDFARAQVDRRELVIDLTERGLLSCSTDSMARAMQLPKARFDFINHIRQGDIQEMPSVYKYIHEQYTSAARNDSISLLNTLRAEIQSLRDSSKNLGIISVPGTPIRITSNDMSTMGILALWLASFWLYACMHNEHRMLVLFLGARNVAKNTWQVNRADIGYNPTDMAKAYHAVANSFMFLAETRPRQLVYQGYEMSLALPAVLSAAVVILDGWEYVRKGLLAWHWQRQLAASIVAASTAVLYYYSVRLQLQNRNILVAWKEAIGRSNGGNARS